jgi:hypothetical protein
MAGHPAQTGWCPPRRECHIPQDRGIEPLAHPSRPSRGHGSQHQVARRIGLMHQHIAAPAIGWTRVISFLCASITSARAGAGTKAQQVTRLTQFGLFRRDDAPDFPRPAPGGNLQPSTRTSATVISLLIVRPVAQ